MQLARSLGEKMINRQGPYFISRPYSLSVPTLSNSDVNYMDKNRYNIQHDPVAISLCTQPNCNQLHCKNNPCAKVVEKVLGGHFTTGEIIYDKKERRQKEIICINNTETITGRDGKQNISLYHTANPEINVGTKDNKPKTEYLRDSINSLAEEDKETYEHVTKTFDNIEWEYNTNKKKK